ncbi:MAG: hypothetical protein HamCj_06780 [Candidatus Hamiltonella defensa (Ceratovacuna japonica)]
MKTLKNLLGCAGLWLISLFTQAEPCRAHQAAQIGSQMGYEQAKKAADAWEKREQYATTALQQCLGSLSTSLTVPTFPDLSSILNGIKDKVCAAGREKSPVLSRATSILGKNGKWLTIQSPKKRSPLHKRSSLIQKRDPLLRSINSLFWDSLT